MRTVIPLVARKLHLGHIAFMRAVVRGLDLRESWDRYPHIEGGVDHLTIVRLTIDWIRESFAAAPRRERRPGLATLVLFDFSPIGEAKPELLSLE